MMSYSVQTTKTAPGVYTLAFGKGAKKLRGILKQDGSGGWVAEQTGTTKFRAATFHRPTKREAKQAWASWASEDYHGKPKKAIRPATLVAAGAAGLGAKHPAVIEVDAEPVAQPWTPLDALEYLLHWARRQNKALTTLPWVEGLRVLRRESPERAARVERV